MRRFVLSGLALGLGLLCTPVWADSAERRVALVIGNSAYQNAPLLPNPARDARAIADQFQKAGYDVSTAFNLGIVDFKRVIRKFEDSAVDAEIAVVYYAGHGIEIHGTNYLVPVDAKLASDRDADDEAVTLERLVSTADGAKSLKLIILDACRDNPFVRTMKVRTAAMRDIRSGLSPVKPTNGDTLIAYAAEAGSAAEDGVGDHSPFAAAVVNHLFIPGLDVRLAFGRIRDEVLKKTNNRQTPYVYGSLGGNNIPIVPGPNDAVAVSDPIGAMRDYLLVEQINSKRAWETFLAQHPNGPLADRARKEIQRLSTEDKVASLEPPKLPTPHDPSSEEQRAWDKIQNSSDANDFRDFIKRFPSSPLANKAQAHVDVLERAAQEKAAKAQADREAAQQAEAERQAEAKRQAEAARLKAEQAAALAAAQQAAKAAEQARLQAEREAALKEEAHQAALAKQAAEAEAARKKAEEEAARKQAEDAKKQAEQAAAAEQARLAAERAKQQAEAEAAKKQAEGAAKKQADADAAKKQAEDAKKQAEQQAAEQARLAAERAKQQAAEQARLAAERAKQQAEAEAAKKQAEEAAKKRAEQEAALVAAKQAAQAAEEARLKAEREAQARQEVACKSEQDRIDVLKTQGSKARDDLGQLEQSLTCERLRPIVTAALEQANALPDVNTPTQIRSAQQELSRLGCFSGKADGALDPATKSAVQHYESVRGQPAENVDISDAFISELKAQSNRVCPLVCPKGRVADGDHCIAAEKPTPVAHQKDEEEPAAHTHATHQKDEEKPAAHTHAAHQKDEEEPAARQKSKAESTARRKDNEEPSPRQQAKRERPVAPPRVIQQATSSSGGYHSGGGGGGATIGVGF